MLRGGKNNLTKSSLGDDQSRVGQQEGRLQPRDVDPISESFHLSADHSGRLDDLEVVVGPGQHSIRSDVWSFETLCSFVGYPNEFAAA